jgi:hypothetical protein
MPRNCYANSGLLASKFPETYFYCEGLAVSRELRAHAWCVDSQRRVVEVAWKAPGLVYFGVVFRAEYVRQLIVQSRLWRGWLFDLARRVRDGRASAYEGIFLDGVPK